MRILKGLFIFAALLPSVVSASTVKSTIGEPDYATGFLGEHNKHGQLFFKPSGLAGIPLHLDLRELGQVSKIKNQASCGSCWAFAITKALESARLRAGLPEIDLAEQEMVSCDKSAYGCGGGFMDDGDYIVKRGLSLEKDYAYSGTNSRCKNPLPQVGDKAVSWSYIGQSSRGPTTDELKQAINTYGVIYVTVSAGGADWGGSRVHMTGCSNRGTNHMVTLVGYNEQDEFIIGNSWGDNWGEQGFAFAKQGCNELASGAESAAFVVYEGGPAPVPPHVRLPAEISIAMGSELLLGVRPEAGVSYQWFVGERLVGSESSVWVSPTEATVYKLVGTSRAGVAESTVLVKVLAGQLEIKREGL